VTVGHDPVEKKFSILCEILRAQHFAWREAVRELCPGIDPARVTARMWEITGHRTAAAYLKRIDVSSPLAPQVARGIVWSSESMGEKAVVESRPDADPEDATTAPRRNDEAFVRHLECPWFRWHEKEQLLAEDRPACDIWFQTVVNDINTALGTRLRVETLDALPDGGPCCLRRLWVDE
jgi:hypothetical protein